MNFLLGILLLAVIIGAPLYLFRKRMTEINEARANKAAAEAQGCEVDEEGVWY